MIGYYVIGASAVVLVGYFGWMVYSSQKIEHEIAHMLDDLRHPPKAH